MKLDPKALERAAHQHTQWNGNPKALGSILALGNTETIVTAYLTTIGETHVLVPREPTEEMLAAGFGACVAEWPDEQCRAELPHIYRAMLAAVKEGE